MNELTERDERKYSKAELLEFARKQLHEITEYCNGDALRNDMDLTDVRSVLLDYIETALQQGAQGGAVEYTGGDLSGVRPCCGNYFSCQRPCTPRGRQLQIRDSKELAEVMQDAASPQPSPSSEGWQPIETAPKDRFILLYCPEDQSRWLAKWQGEQWYGVDELGLTRTGMGPNDVTGWKVTQWREIPTPPKS